jgi:hypothetical protein
LECPGSIAGTFQNQQMVNCHIFGAPGTILICHTYLTYAIYPEEARKYPQDNFLHKDLPLEEPIDQLLKTRRACVNSTCVLHWPQIALPTYLECTDFL